jgi:hypothetical protein
MNQTLTPEQEAQLDKYRHKWRQIALSVEPIDRTAAIATVKTLYKLLHQPEPKLLLCDSPRAVCNLLMEFKAAQPLGEGLSLKISRLFYDHLHDTVERQPGVIVPNLLHQGLYQVLSDEANRFDFQGLIFDDLKIYQRGAEFAAIADEVLMGAVLAPAMHQHVGCLTDFCIHVLQCGYDGTIWEVLQGILGNTYWIFPFESVCVICDRPSRLTLDANLRLHGEGEAALQFADGYGLFVYHGILLPEQYASVHPHAWQAAWLLEEENAELRRVLIQGIGYGRLCQELEAIALDSWREYELLKINAETDIEPILLLKMTCPSTAHIHVVRVPLKLRSAREAIRWVNHGIDPEEFAVET